MTHLHLVPPPGTNWLLGDVAADGAAMAVESIDCVRRRHSLVRGEHFPRRLTALEEACDAARVQALAALTTIEFIRDGDVSERRVLADDLEGWRRGCDAALRDLVTIARGR